MLKAPIENEALPTRGTPQGGILSPLLSNICLNDLDWWLSSQWVDFPTKTIYWDKYSKLRAIKATNLKRFHFVRYADDFKILCGDYNTAIKVFMAVNK